jgi:hypothetical protein
MNVHQPSGFRVFAAERSKAREQAQQQQCDYAGSAPSIEAAGVTQALAVGQVAEAAG